MELFLYNTISITPIYGENPNSPKNQPHYFISFKQIVSKLPCQLQTNDTVINYNIIKGIIKNVLKMYLWLLRKNR